MNNKQDIREIKLKIRQVLLEEWDPIGVSDDPLALDEYDGYLGGVYGLVERNASASELAEYLYFIETVNMGMRGRSKEKLSAVAGALKRIPI